MLKPLSMGTPVPQHRDSTSPFGRAGSESEERRGPAAPLTHASPTGGCLGSHPGARGAREGAGHGGKAGAVPLLRRCAWQGVGSRGCASGAAWPPGCFSSASSARGGWMLACHRSRAFSKAKGKPGCHSCEPLGCSSSTEARGIGARW